MKQQSFEYWIDIGRTGGQFTLHRRLIRPIKVQQDREIFGISEFTYIRNLGRIYAEAVQRADNWIASMHSNGYPFDAVKLYSKDDSEADLRHRGKYDDDQFWFGKYRGEAIEEIVERDREYVMFIRDNFYTVDPRMGSLIEKLQGMDLGKSLAQIEQEEREAREAEEKAKLRPIPREMAEGRSTLTGHIVCTYQRETMYGRVTKMIFFDDRGFKVCGTAPGALWDIFGFDAKLEGKRIQFDAAVTISDNDETFGFYKRPTKIVAA